MLRPEATTLRPQYGLVANVLIGLGGSAMMLAGLVRQRAAAAGFRSASRAAVSLLIATSPGSLAYWLQAPPPRPPAVLVNGFAQVFTVSAAEVVVCRSVTAAVIAMARATLVTLFIAHRVIRRTERALRPSTPSSRS